jgi:hypothetical protein
VWLISKDGRAFNLDRYIRIESSRGNLIAYHAGQGPGTGSTTIATDLSEGEISDVFRKLLLGEGVDLRSRRSAYADE